MIKQILNSIIEGWRRAYFMLRDDRFELSKFAEWIREKLNDKTIS